MPGGEVCMAGEMATAADGTHPTGMHSCYILTSIYSSFSVIAMLHSCCTMLYSDLTRISAA